MKIDCKNLEIVSSMIGTKKITGKKNCLLFRNAIVFSMAKQTNMKIIFSFLFFLPLFLAAQTVHRKGNKIVYEDEVMLPGRNADQLNTALQAALLDLVKKGKTPANVRVSEQAFVADGDMKLSSNHPISRLVNYTLSLKAKDSGYAYRIDSVFVIEKKSGEAEKKRTAKQLLQEMEVSGPVAEAAEKILNEIDMNFQKLLVLLKTKLQKTISDNQ